MAGLEKSTLRHRAVKQHLNQVDKSLENDTNKPRTVDQAGRDSNVAMKTVTNTTAVAAKLEGESTAFTNTSVGTSSTDIYPQDDSSSDEEPKMGIIPPPNTPVVREYVEVTDPITGRVKLAWNNPITPYTTGIEIVEAKASEPEPKQSSVATFLDDSLRVLGVVSLVSYLGSTIAHSTSTGILSPATLFAIGQVYENSGNVLEGIWGTVMSAARDPQPRPALKITGENVPSVDVLVVCCGEPDDVVMDTVKAACHIDWPETRLRVFVADDGRSSTLRQEVEQLQATHPNLHYHSREKPANKPHGYKAGNLNATLKKYVEKTVQGYSEYLAVFDADMMPEPEILRALLPHAIRDPEMAMVTAAQFHYNVPHDDPLNQGNTTGAGAEDGKRDRINAAWCPGSGFILRTSAWVDIGMFPEFSITEDLITSWLLHGKGWKIALVPGKMQWGLQPDCLLTHLKQRRRWWTGHIPDALRFNFALNAEALSGTSFMQRYAMFHHACRPYIMTITHAINTALTLTCLAWGGSVIDPSNVHAVKEILFWLTFHHVVQFIGDLKTLLTNGTQEYLKVRRMVATGVWMAHHFSRDTLQTLLPKSLGGMRLGFIVSGVDVPQVAIKERDINKRCDLFTRLRVIHQREGVLWHLVLFLATVILIVYRVGVEVKGATVGNKAVLNNDFWLKLITSVGFPGLGLIETVPYYLTPIIYLVFPPTMPDRRDTMVQDEKTGLWKPLEEYKTVKYTMAS